MATFQIKAGRAAPTKATATAAEANYQLPPAIPQLRQQRQYAKPRGSQERRRSTHSLYSANHRQQHHRLHRRSSAATHSRSPRILDSGAKFTFGARDPLVNMIAMLFVVAVVVSGNTALAAQRDPYKAKDSQGLNNNANAIPNAISGIGSAAGNGDSNNVNSGNTNSNSANGNNTTGDSSSSSSATTAESTFITTAITTATSSGSNSYSLQKAGGGSGGFSGINRNAIEALDDGRNGPYFDKAASKNITALLGKTAYLNCRVKNLGNKTMLLQVSWVRHRDIHLLTVGRYTYTSDQRFRAIHQPQTEDWILQIKYPQHRDSGVYECQVSTTPHMSHYIHLNVVEPSTEIIGAPDLYIESGSTINLTCVILNSPEPPAYIFWNHNNAIINYDSPRGGVSVVTNKGERTTSFLLIKSARPSDSGHYQCNPSNAKPKSVTVHVLNGEFPAAMQHAAPPPPRMSVGRYLWLCLSIYCCTSAYVRRSMPPRAAGY